MPSVRKPGSTACTRQRARMSRPADTSSTTERATSAITSAPRSRSRRPPTPARAPSRKPAASTSRSARQAGAMPKPTAMRTVVIAAKTRMRQSTVGVSAIGSVVGTRRATSGVAVKARSTPSAPPSSASSRLSVRSWRSRRSRPAPSAVRTASSCRRTSARASSRLARFVHAMSRTHKAAPKSAFNSRRAWGETSSRRRTRLAPVPTFSG